MTAILDLNHIVFSNASYHFKTAPLDEGVFRHLVLNSIRASYSTFKHEHPELVIASDSRRYWRRDIFPLYKVHRKQDRQESGLDWPMIFGFMDKIKQEMRENLPYRLIEIERAEADDIVAVLTKMLVAKNTPVLILSDDKDYGQLHGPLVKQFRPVKKDWITIDNPSRFLLEHIIRGDFYDGIPNIKADDDMIANRQKQPMITKRFIDEVADFEELEMKGTKYERNYNRNKLLIDFRMIPAEIQTAILDAYNNTPENPRTKLSNYLIENNLSYLYDRIRDF